jgi:hypothetical protein
MTAPLATDYNEAFQNLQHNLLDAELKKGNVMCGNLGLPLQISGANASVFKINLAAETWAVKCFLKEIGDRDFRYGLISDYINRSNRDFYVSFNYLKNGIRVNGRVYPILKMKWVNGTSLESFVESSLLKIGALEKLLQEWETLITKLKKDKVAHGDLQHGNILVSSSGKLLLIDYDDMYVNGLDGIDSNVIGHLNYQHSKRTQILFNKDTDNFSAWIIYLSIKALINDPKIWTKSNGGDDCLIFRRSDYEDFKNSDAFQILRDSSNSQNKKIADFICRLCEAKVEEVDQFSIDTFERFGKPKPRPKKQQHLDFGNDWINDHIEPESTNQNTKSTKRVPEKSTINLEQVESELNSSWIQDHILHETRKETKRSDKTEGELQDNLKDLPNPSLDDGWINDYIKKKVEVQNSFVYPYPFFSLSPLMVSLLYYTLSLFPGNSYVLSASILYLLVAFPTILSKYRYIREDFNSCLKNIEIVSLMSTTYIEKQKPYLVDLELYALNVSKELDSCRSKSSILLLRSKAAKISSSKYIKLAKKKIVIENRINRLESDLSKYEHEMLNAKDVAAKIVAANYKRLLNTSTKKHIRFILTAWGIRENEIPGLPISFKTKLIDSGITSAVDIIPSRLSAIPQLTPDVIKSLNNWKKSVKRKALLSSPNKISDSDMQSHEQLSIQVLNKWVKPWETKCGNLVNEVLPSARLELINIEKSVKGLSYTCDESYIKKITEINLELALTSETYVNHKSLHNSARDLYSSVEKEYLLEVTYSKDIYNKIIRNKSARNSILRKYSGLSFSIIPSSYSEILLVIIIGLYYFIYIERIS